MNPAHPVLVKTKLARAYEVEDQEYGSYSGIPMMLNKRGVLAISDIDSVARQTHAYTEKTK
jgi:hypothetical protein